MFSSAQCPEWSIDFVLHNDGPLAARFIALHVVCGPGVQLEGRGGAQWLPPWRPLSALQSRTAELWYKGGSDTVIHPAWPFAVPRLGPATLHVDGPYSQTEFTFNVEVVADDVKPFSQTFTIHVPPGK